jgi:hypothetical protein
MRDFFRIFLYSILALISFSCVSVDKIARHDFDSGYYMLTTEDKNHTDIYASYTGDSITVYPLIKIEENRTPDTSSFTGSSLKDIINGNLLYKSCFTNTTIDIDLTTVIMKFRPGRQGVPNQLNANLNAAIYTGYRKNFYKLIPEKTPLREAGSHIRQISIDGGFFAGIGITPVNPTVTSDGITQEYDGIVFQKGIASFLTFDNISVGLSIGFDNLLDKNKSIWIYNQKPYIGLMIGIANF